MGHGQRVFLGGDGLIFCNGGHIGGCVEFKTPGNGMLKLARVESFPILNEQYTTFPRLVAKDLAKAALPDVLVLIIGGALQLVQAANVFDNQGYVCAENDLKTAYLPWVWLPVFLPVLTVITKVVCNSVLSPKGPLHHFLDLIEPDDPSSELDSGDEHKESKATEAKV